MKGSAKLDHLLFWPLEGEAKELGQGAGGLATLGLAAPEGIVDESDGLWEAEVVGFGMAEGLLKGPLLQPGAEGLLQSLGG